MIRARVGSLRGAVERRQRTAGPSAGGYGRLLQPLIPQGLLPGHDCPPPKPLSRFSLFSPHTPAPPGAAWFAVGLQGPGGRRAWRRAGSRGRGLRGSLPAQARAVRAAAAPPGGGRWKGAARPPFGAALAARSPGWRGPCWAAATAAELARRARCRLVPAFLLPPSGAQLGHAERAPAAARLPAPAHFFTAGFRLGLTGEGTQRVSNASLSPRAALPVGGAYPEAPRRQRRRAGGSHAPLCELQRANVQPCNRAVAARAGELVPSSCSHSFSPCS